MTIDPRLEPHDLLAAYLLHAVDEHELQVFEEHLVGCPDCERELAELAPTVEALGASVPAAPPGHLRAAVLRQVGEERRDRQPADPAERSDRTDPTDELGARRAQRSSRRLVLLAGAAAAVAVIMAMFFGPFRGDAPMTPAMIAAAADAERYEVRIGDATATIIVSRELDRAAIETSDMAPAPDGQDYQLWFAQADGTMTPAGLMPDTEDPAMVLPDELGDAVGVGITMEPEGGSPQPTSEPMVIVPFEA
jgi:anti-sigma-K factor RskA